MFFWTSFIWLCWVPKFSWAAFFIFSRFSSSDCTKLILNRLSSSRLFKCWSKEFFSKYIVKSSSEYESSSWSSASSSSSSGAVCWATSSFFLREPYLIIALLSYPVMRLGSVIKVAPPTPSYFDVGTAAPFFCLFFLPAWIDKTSKKCFYCW